LRIRSYAFAGVAILVNFS